MATAWYSSVHSSPLSKRKIHMKPILTLAAASAVLFSNATLAAPKPAIALVHGAFEDVHVWDRVSAKLQADGFRVLTVNLPGRPSAPMGADQVSLDVYRDTVLKAIEGERDPVVLVGHSFGGIVISAVGEAEPARIKTLVYLAAYLPQSGASVVSLAKGDRDSKEGKQLVIDKETGMASINYAARADLFANGASAQVRRELPDAMVDEPVGPLLAPVTLSAPRFGVIDKVYIYTAKDKMVSPYLQHKMTSATPVRLTFTLNTGHSPFLTDVPGLVKAIELAAR